MRRPLRSFLAALPIAALAGCSSGSPPSSPIDASTSDAAPQPMNDGGPGDSGSNDASYDAAADGADGAPSCGTVNAACCPGSTCTGPLSCKSGTCQTAPTPVSVDVINASLDGPAPFSAQRAPYIYKDIAARTSDIVCVLGVPSLSDRTKIAQAAMTASADGGPAQFPYSYMVTTDVSTPPSNPSDVVAAPASAPCGQGVSAASVSAAYTCVEQNCSTTAGGDPAGTGTLSGTGECLSSSCAAPFGALYSAISPTSTTQQLANDSCFDCMLYYLSSAETIATGQTDCTTQATAPFGYDGQTPVMILSNRPLLSTTSYNLGATGFRRAILKAQIQLANEEVVDFFCGDLSSPFLDTTLPYTGSYGSDVATDGGAGNGWQGEQDHQAKEAVAWIQQQVAADKVPAIIAMDLHSDDASSAGADGGVSSLSPEVVDLFASNFTPALPPSGGITCDYCPAPQNPYNTGTQPYELLHTYLSGFPSNATMSETL